MHSEAHTCKRHSVTVAAVMDIIVITITIKFAGRKQVFSKAFQYPRTQGRQLNLKFGFLAPLSFCFLVSRAPSPQDGPTMCPPSVSSKEMDVKTLTRTWDKLTTGRSSKSRLTGTCWRLTEWVRAHLLLVSPDTGHTLS